LTSFEKFGEAFQTKILYHIIMDKMFALQVMEILDPDFFSNESYVELADIIRDWNEKYNTIPSFENLETLVKTKKEDEIEREYLLTLIEAIRSIADVSDKTFVIEETVKFCKQQAMRNAILQSVDLLNREEYDKIYSVVQRAITAGQAKDIGHTYVESVLGRTTEKRYPVATGFPLLDTEHIAGGLSAGELGLFLGGTGAGKSFLLAQIAYAAFMQGKTSVIYSFELGEVSFGLRLDSKFTGIPLSNLLSDTKGAYRKQVIDAINKAKENIDGNPEIIIKEYPTKGVTLPTMKNHLLQLKAKGLKPDVIIVDYADLIRPTSSYKEKRYELESTVEQLRGWAREEGVPVWSASQTNREGWDTAVVKLGTISEAASKAFVADLVIAIGRDQNLIDNNMACYYIAKSRLGRDKIPFVGRFDTSTMDFTIDEEGYDAEHYQVEEAQNNMNEAVRNVLRGTTSPRTANSNLQNIIDLIGE
jgi:replicative DNA helicase